MDWNWLMELFVRPLFAIGQTEISLATMVSTLLVILLVILLSRLGKHLVQRQLLARLKMDPGLQHVIARFVGYAILVLGFVIGLQTVGINLSSLAVLAGALGVGIGFGLQNLVNNFVSGLVLLADRTVKVGDRIEVDGTAGRVVKIGARACSILTNDNIVIIVPNSEFTSSRVVNWSHGDAKVRIRIPVGVSYGSDVRQVEKILLEAAREHPDVLRSPEPMVVITGFGDSSVDFEVRAWTVEMAQRPGRFKGDLYLLIWDKFREAGVEIPFPQRDLHVKEPIPVRMTG